MTVPPSYHEARSRGAWSCEECHSVAQTGLAGSGSPAVVCVADLWLRDFTIFKAIVDVLQHSCSASGDCRGT